MQEIYPCRRYAASLEGGLDGFLSRRARKLREVSLCMRSTGSRDADQAGVWDEIDAKARRMKAESATRAAAEMYEQSRAQLDGLGATS